MLKVRLITAFTLLPLVLGLFIFGPAWAVGLGLLFCLGMCVYETAAILIPAFEKHFGLISKDGTPVAKEPTVPTRDFPLVAVGLGIAVWIFCATSAREAAMGLLVVTLLLALLIGVFSSRIIDRAVSRAFGILISLCYGAFPWVVVWQLYLMMDHAGYLLLVMAVTWMGDTGGYFGGRFLGGKIFGPNHLAPIISPKKTWEGAISGLLMSIVGALVINAIFAGRLCSNWLAVLIGIVGGTCGQLGDLVESTFKRFAGVKDSGHILPGHGGFLDRVDAILFSAPVIWAMLYYLN